MYDELIHSMLQNWLDNILHRRAYLYRRKCYLTMLGMNDSAYLVFVKIINELFPYR